jgi:hypothetical protein
MRYVQEQIQKRSPTSGRLQLPTLWQTVFNNRAIPTDAPTKQVKFLRPQYSPNQTAPTQVAPVKSGLTQPAGER